MTSKIPDQNSLIEHYRSLYKEFGSSHNSVQYSSKESQIFRYSQLIRIGALKDKKILDFGCGMADFLQYLQENDLAPDRFIGVEIVPEFLNHCVNLYPSHTFVSSLNNLPPDVVDYSFVSGTFNNNRIDADHFWKTSVKKLFTASSKGMSFNMMSKYVDYESPGLYYVFPEDVYRYCKSITPYVEICNAYAFTRAKPPFEFVVNLYKNPKICMS
ncbi:class I SAM-dependent methyltransferase [Synechococcus sp. HB1133]|uniref:class I SAM-dependent methyltransferase n=1 Tax=unclassified Synechococcus TaxID=2626047 RepID=UPI00140A0CA7|nr:MULTISPECIES: class I SAM-dependent methyltransferase [unclassified Synechococcus]MCB4421665.1 class I SAM-dependent methyltransferase [Synechococcus sp. HB1133]MCB4430983.1 class I SAM-dependent methyltransferase [Synechococcus sp. HBA1120]NHI80607.1 class I SAM-dependent methyltransferase [Synechococcus sp. HB1133]